MPIPTHFLALSRRIFLRPHPLQRSTALYNGATQRALFASKAGDHSELTHKQEHTSSPPTNAYHMPPADHGDHSSDHHEGEEHHAGPRDHLNKDGTVNWGLSSDHFHWYDPYRSTPPKFIETVDGVKMIKGVETRPLDELYAVTQENLPFWPRTKMNFWGNHQLGLKIEFLFFWIPTFIIASLAIPCLTMIYMNEESIYSTMTIKVIGRQWYWMYEVESPAEEEE